MRRRNREVAVQASMCDVRNLRVFTVFIVLTLMIVSSLISQNALASTLSSERQVELEHLLRQDCGSCHGMTLKGGLGLPLTTQALSGKSEHYLFAAIREGIPGTPMPPWSALLDDEEIRWLVKRLMSGVAQP